MNKYLTARLRIVALLAVLGMAAMTMVAPQVATAQNTPQKIRLMAETLRARDSGDLTLAKEKAEELIKIAPNDENVQRLLGSINAELDRRTQGSAVYGQASQTTVEDAIAASEMTAPAAPAAAAAEPEMAMPEESSVVKEVADDQNARIAQAEQAIEDAEKLAELGAYADATNLLTAAGSSLTLNTATADVIEEIDQAKADVIYAEAVALLEAGDAKAAESRIEAYRAAGGSARKAAKLGAKADAIISDPNQYDLSEVSASYVAQTKVVRDLLARGRAQFLNGDYDGASATFKEVEARDPNNAEAKLFSTRIAEIIGGIHAQNQYKTREQMLSEVDQNWERPKIFDVQSGAGDVVVNPGLQDKLNEIVIPQVNFAGMELSRVLSTLSELSYDYAADGVGVNIIPLYNATQKDPKVNISLRNLNLDRILQFVTQQVNYAYDVSEDAVTVTPDGGADSVSTATEFFPISRATVIRLTGFRDGGGSSSGPVDPFAAPSSASSGPSQNDETQALSSFFQSAGVNFDLPGTSLAFDGEQLIVTQTRRNLERMRTILRNYNEVKQVEIESKFLEVSQNDLDELGFNWVAARDGQAFSFGSDDQFLGSDVVNGGQIPLGANARGLAGAFGGSGATNAINISGEDPVPVNAPTITQSIDLATGANSIFGVTGWAIGGLDVDMSIRALARKSGSDLMSAPKVTVLSGKRANIVVAQELRYPESYGDIESTVSSNNTGGAAISITAGTPQDFVTRNVGVEMSVTPNVENDDTISLILEPRVTEFEGFVEFGGPSIALAGGTVATVPAGFYQPVFSTREVSTEVTIFDGATVVMGGLTRDEVKTVNDKVPVLGDIPGLGRLFRSEGETRQKRNLLIFVTANMVSPGGSPARQSYRNVNANSLFQNPTIMTPSGTVNRSVDEAGQ